MGLIRLVATIVRSCQQIGGDLNRLDYSKTLELMSPTLPVMELHESGRFVEAISCCDAILHKNKNNYYALWIRGLSLAEIKNFDKALEDIKKAVLIKPREDFLYLGMGEILFEAGRFKEAIKPLKKAMALSHNNLKACFLAGCSFYELKNYKNALFYFNIAINIKPFDIGIWFNKGVTLYKLKKYKNSIACLDKILADASDHLMGQYEFIISELKCIRSEDVISFLNMAIKLYPDKNDYILLKEKFIMWELLEKNLAQSK